jgi:prophage tail gpP-like protein
MKALDKRNNQVRLVVQGTEYSGWKSVRITAGIERQARDFELQVTDHWPGQTDIPRRIQPGDACQVFIGEDLVMTGYVDATPIQYDSQAYSVSVQGRSKTADLVDCCPVPSDEPIKPAPSSWGNSKPKASSARGFAPAPAKSAWQWRNQKLQTIAAALAAPYDVRVISETDTGLAIPLHQVQVGETVFQSIDRMMRLRQVLSSDNEQGDLVIISLGSAGRADNAIESGVNILTGSAKLDYKGVYSEYIVKGQRPGTADQYGADVSEQEGRVKDSEALTVLGASAQGGNARPQRRRLLTIKQRGAADTGTCYERAQYERSHRLAQAVQVNYTVAGWRQASGALWRPNLLVPVRDRVIGFDTDMLICECTWQMDETGLRTEIHAGPA